MKIINKDDIELVQTCFACPEQYDAFIEDKKVGYLRLRGGVFYVRAPYSGGDIVYEAHTKGDGLFESEERGFHLDKAKEAIVKNYNKNDYEPK